MRRPGEGCQQGTLPAGLVCAELPVSRAVWCHGVGRHLRWCRLLFERLMLRVNSITDASVCRGSSQVDSRLPALSTLYMAQQQQHAI